VARRNETCCGVETTRLRLPHIVSAVGRPHEKNDDQLSIDSGRIAKCRFDILPRSVGRLPPSCLPASARTPSEIMRATSISSLRPPLTLSAHQQTVVMRRPPRDVQLIALKPCSGCASGLLELVPPSCFGADPFIAVDYLLISFVVVSE
jgi:hypothetical protein